MWGIFKCISKNKFEGKSLPRIEQMTECGLFDSTKSEVVFDRCGYDWMIEEDFRTVIFKTENGNYVKIGFHGNSNCNVAVVPETWVKNLLIRGNLIEDYTRIFGVMAEA